MLPIAVFYKQRAQKKKTCELKECVLKNFSCRNEQGYKAEIAGDDAINENAVQETVKEENIGTDIIFLNLSMEFFARQI